MHRPTLSPTTRRSQVVLGAAALTGALVGLMVWLIEWLSTDVILEQVLDAPLWQQALAPGAGLALAALVLRWGGPDTSPTTADAYIGNFHEPRRRLPFRPFPAKLLAGVATIGFGGPMGLEGPSIYAGSAIGSQVQARLSRFFSRDDAKLLLVAGAAAGVAAVFRTPATGVIFALEVPYRDDVAHRALIPALIASASSYLVFVTATGTEPIFRLVGAVPSFELSELGGAAALGVLAGLGARGFAWLVHRAKDAVKRYPVWSRVGVASAVLAGLVLLSNYYFSEPLSLGPGYRSFEWAFDPRRGLELVALLFAIRAVGTIAALGGGGAGGLFIPLATLGLLLGRFVAGAIDQPDSALFPVIGIAAFLGAGYRTPIASVMFVAEFTGRAGFVVPALVAAAVSQLLMGRWSVSSVQQSARSGHLERRFALPITTALTTDVLTVPADATMAEFVWVHVLGNRERSVPVVHDGRYLGMCDLELVSEVPREHWDETTVEPIINDTVPTGRATWTLRDAIAAMDDADVDRLAVIDADGGFVGMVFLSEILKLDEILEETGD